MNITYSPNQTGLWNSVLTIKDAGGQQLDVLVKRRASSPSLRLSQVLLFPLSLCVCTLICVWVLFLSLSLSLSLTLRVQVVLDLGVCFVGARTLTHFDMENTSQHAARYSWDNENLPLVLPGSAPCSTSLNPSRGTIDPWCKARIEISCIPKEVCCC